MINCSRPPQGLPTGVFLVNIRGDHIAPSSRLIVRQMEFLAFLQEMGHDGHTQFIISTHSPILLSCPNATIFSFDGPKIDKVPYEETEHYCVYRDFILERAGKRH